MNKFSALDGMRGVAALLVLSHHTEIYWGAKLSTNHSYLAVDLFFILSGFVISHAYAQKLRDGRLSGARFMAIRWIRLWPLLVLGAVIGAAWNVANHAFGIGTVLPALALMAFFLPFRLPGSDGLFRLNDPSWSLFFEMVVNALYALVQPWLSDGRLKALVLCSGLGVVVVAFYCGSLDVGYTWSGRSLGGGLVRAVYGIFLGAWLHRCHVARPADGKGLDRIGPWPLMVALTILLTVPGDDQFDVVFDLISVLLVLPLCVYLGARVRVDERSARMFSFLGLLSYPLYVLHRPLSEMLAGPLGTPLVAYAPLGGTMLVVVLVGVALLLDRFYDQPLRRFLSQRMTADRKAATSRR